MTRQDYELIARTVSYAKTLKIPESIEVFIEEFCRREKQRNPKFDPTTFKRKCDDELQ